MHCTYLALDNRFEWFLIFLQTITCPIHTIIITTAPITIPITKPTTQGTGDDVAEDPAVTTGIGWP